MDFYQDVKKFEQLSHAYRNAVKDNHLDIAKNLKKEILILINFNAERVAQNFNIKLNKRTTKMDKGKGILLPSLSIAKIIEKGNNLKTKHITSLNPFATKKIDGVNFFLDYSGSMWYYEEKEKINDIQRIFYQNFLTLVMAQYITITSRQKTKLFFNCYSIFTHTEEIEKLDEDNIDLFLPSMIKPLDTGRLVTGTNGLNYLPNKLLGLSRKDFCGANFKEAIEKTLILLRNKKFNNVISLFFTDGGLFRLGESKDDMKKYLIDVMFKLNSLGKNMKSIFTFIKITERDGGQVMVDATSESNMIAQRLETVEQFNLCFEKFTSLINQMR